MTQGPLFLLFLAVCILPSAVFGQTADPKATRKTRALFTNLRYLSGQKTMFGHQDDLAYGVFWRQEEGRSDVKETCGAYPAVFGWDLNSRFGSGLSARDSSLSSRIGRAYSMGGINTLSWHLDNLVSGGNAWDTSMAVRDLLPGGQYHERFTNQLDVLAEFLSGLKTGGLLKHRIPVIFRPWHEHTGHWFWWGASSCTPEEYKALFRFTVDYLRREKGVHNVLYAYSPDVFQDREHYLRHYPGDDYVDVFGLDYYYRPENLTRIQTDLPEKLALVAELAAEHGKVAAFTETGFEGIPDDTWWTEMLLCQIEEATREAGISYVLVWRNATNVSKPGHFYAPYPGHLSAKNFVEFSRSGRMVFQDRLPDLYRKSKTQKSEN